MMKDDLRFYFPETNGEMLALAHARVAQRRAGLRLMKTISGSLTVAGASFEVLARRGIELAARAIPVVIIFASMSGAALVIVVASALLWNARLRHILIELSFEEDRPSSRRQPDDRPHIRDLDGGVLRPRRELHAG